MFFVVKLSDLVVKEITEFLGYNIICFHLYKTIVIKVWLTNTQMIGCFRLDRCVFLIICFVFEALKYTY